jgi:signal transduction histidine kinase
MADLSEQLSKLVAKINNQGKIKVAFKEDGECPKLPLKISHDILEIVNEALHNSIKHSGGDQASVEIAYSSDRISLKISDNGRGFSETDFNALVRQGKIGLMSMKERTESNNGTISFSGSSISITIPLSRDEMPKEDENE